MTGNNSHAIMEPSHFLTTNRGLNMKSVTKSQSVSESSAPQVNTLFADQVDTNTFVEKVRLVSNVTCKEEEFNVWHANADKAVSSFVWGGLAKQD